MIDDFPLLAQRMFNTPIAIHPRKAEIAMAALADRLGHHAACPRERRAGARRLVRRR